MQSKPIGNAIHLRTDLFATVLISMFTAPVFAQTNAQGKAFTLDDLSRDPEAKQVAQGLLQYLKVLAVLKQVRDPSRVNKQALIISAGMATGSGGLWQQKLQLDRVPIPVG